ncbi:Dynactin subunit 1 like protein [Argiope bruennichi]|uniref:Dynactin subunit 1 n=1 Tax=Argiope bruennichi TaxID=94029 RepID=A0A8T0EBP2_ARGBR|nr:Dynactin subunit 1 like protein [Argiope bruennichi]
MASFTIGDRVLILGKNATGKIAFVGHTHFLDDLCFGVILDEPKGRNNGSFEGVRYFKCTRNHGIFVRACQLRRVSQHEIKIVKTEDKIKNVMRYPNYLKTKNSLRLQEDKRKQKNAALTTRKMNSDTQLCPLKPKIQLKKESNCKKETVLKKESSLLNTEPTKNVVIQAKHSLSLNSKICYFQELESQTLDNEVDTEAAKMKHRIKKLETELKYARKVIEKNKTDKETLEEQLDYYQKHAYALQKKINKLNRDLTESDRKTKALEQKMEQLHQITEISIIEKEMAEHKIEQMEADLQELTTTCQILQTELSIKEEEMEIQCENKVPTVHYMKQLDYKNKILYNALLQLRKLYILKHQNLLEAEETIKNNMSALKDLAISQENLQNVIYVLNQDVSDMHETIDGLTEADELVCEVTERSLILEHKMDALVETLKIMEESIEVSNEIEEILQESYLEREKEIEAMEQKVYQTEKSLLKTTNLVNDYKEELEKYRHLVSDLRMRNDFLELKVQTVTQERKLAVMEAENLKLQFHRVNKMTLQHLVKDDNLDIENQTFQQQVKYLEMYLPENFFGRNEHLALQGKLLLFKVIQKLNLFQKYIISSDFKHSFPSVQNQLQVLVFQTHFLLKVLTLQELLQTYDFSLDNGSIQNFLSSGAFYEILNIKQREIDHYLNLFCRNDLDTPQNMKILDNTINMLHTMFNLKFCPEHKRRIINMEYLLKKIFVCVKCIEEYSMLTKASLKHSENVKLKNIEFRCSALIKDITYLLKRVTVSKEFQKTFNNEDSVSRLKHMLFELMRLMERYVKFCNRICDRYEKIYSIFLLKVLKKLDQISMEIQHLKNLIQEVERSETCDPVTSSIFVSWIKEKKAQEEKWINELQRKAFFFEKNVSNKNLQQIKETQITKQTIEKSSQTEENSDEIIQNEKMTILSLKLHDMECSAHFFKFKVHQLQMERMQNQLSYLTPLKLLPKRKRYHPDVHKIIMFQKSLNKVSDDLMKIILPTVVDISSQKNSCKSFKYSPLIQRELFKKDIQMRIQNLETEIHDFKNENRFK